MIFEILTSDEETVCVSIDHDTFNEILKMLVVEAYHMGKREKNADMDSDHPEENRD